MQNEMEFASDTLSDYMELKPKSNKEKLPAGVTVLTNLEKNFFNKIAELDERIGRLLAYQNNVFNKLEAISTFLSFLVYQQIKSGSLQSKELEKIKEVIEMANIEWSLFDSKYVKFEEGDPIDLELSEWQQTEKEFDGEKRILVEFKVTTENGRKVDKILSASKVMVRALAQYIKNAEATGAKNFRVRITRTGSGKNTRYSVKAL